MVILKLMQYCRSNFLRFVLQGSRKVLVKHAGSVAELMEELKDEVVFLAQHLFWANWQVKQFESMRTSHPFPPATVGMILDFAENFTCTFQNEVHAAHWHHEQVTLHPIVSYYQCPQDE